MQDRTDLDTVCINTIRTLSMDAVQAANSGHPGTPMALAPAAYRMRPRQSISFCSIWSLTAGPAQAASAHFQILTWRR
jgi:hypothetical protein